MKSIPIAKPSIGPEEIRAVTRVLKSGQLSLGPVHKEFEARFAKYIGTKHACTVSSGTAGLHLAMIAAGIGPGDEVITSPFSFIASSNGILYVGAKPVFVDIDPVSYNMDAAKVEKAVTKKTKAILVVHIFGQAADMGPIMRIAKKYKLAVIEDACESIGATYKGKPVGTFGESSVFAFYPNKQMTTGEGGMVVTDSDRVQALMKSLSNQGRNADMQWLDHVRLGYNYRMDEMSAALGLEQLKKLNRFIAERRRIASWYEKAFAKHAGLVQVPQTAPGNTHTYFVYVVQLLHPNVKRDEIIARLKGEGIGSKTYLPSIHLFRFYREQFGFHRGDFPVSEQISDRALALPMFVGLTQNEVARVASTLIRLLKTYDA